jgi:hypothetical protein
MSGFLSGILSLFLVVVGFGLLVVLNGLWLFPLVLLVFGREAADAALPVLIVLPFLFALVEIIAFEVVRARWRQAKPAGPNASGHPHDGVTTDRLVKKQT